MSVVICFVFVLFLSDLFWVYFCLCLILFVSILGCLCYDVVCVCLLLFLGCVVSL